MSPRSNVSPNYNYDTSIRGTLIAMIRRSTQQSHHLVELVDYLSFIRDCSKHLCIPVL